MEEINNDNDNNSKTIDDVSYYLYRLPNNNQKTTSSTCGIESCNPVKNVLNCKSKIAGGPYLLLTSFLAYDEFF